MLRGHAHSHLSFSTFFKSMYWTFPFSLIKDVSSQLTILIKSEPKTADQKLRTSKPEIKPETIISIIAFTTNRKSPNVRTVMGSVNIINMGRKIALSIARAAAAKKAEKKPLTYIPSIKYEARIIEQVRINHLIKNPCIIIFSFIAPDLIT